MDDVPMDPEEKLRANIFVDNIGEESNKDWEFAITDLAKLYVEQKNADAISSLATSLRPLFADVPKAKTAKIVRTLIDLVSNIPGTDETQIDMCSDWIEWCKTEKRTFLRQRIETRLADLYLKMAKYSQCLALLGKLLVEVKKLDDKLLLVEIYLIECRTNYALQNIPKAKASLTASKTSANAIHCPPLLQARIDLWSGIVSSREKDFRTGFSYFYEGFEAFNQADSYQDAKTAMKYMLLTKIMMNLPHETGHIISSKNSLKYTGIEIDAMAAVAKAMEERSLKKFENVLAEYSAELSGDPIISYHLKDLNETLLEQNILRILEPFSRVEISHVAELIVLPLERTQAKLREMILDQKLNGTLDQGVGVLIVFEVEQVPSTYNNALQTIKNTSEVLDTLYGDRKSVV